MPDSELRILVPLDDPAAGDPVIRFASALARIHEGELHLAATAPEGESAPRAERQLRRAVGLAEETGVRVVPHLVKDWDVVEGVAAAAKDRHCNMLVMGWRGETGEDAVRAARNRALVRAVDVETLVLKVREFRPARRILVPTGGGSHALMGIQIAHELAGAWNAEIEILRIVRDRRCRPDDPILKRYCDQVLEDMRLKLKVLDIQAPLTVLPAAEVIPPIVERVREDDLVVLGASNDWRREKHLEGSIPEEIAAQVPGPVLMVRTPGTGDVLLSRVFWEQSIYLNLRATDKWDAITRMLDALIDEKQVPPSERQHVLDTAVRREQESATSLGLETAVPHAPMANLPGIIGCLGICPEGIDFEGAHKDPVRYIFLLLTPRKSYRLYIPVLARIAEFMRSGETRAALLRCQTPSEVTALIKRHENA